MADRLKYKRRLVSNQIVKQQQMRKKFRRNAFYVFLFVMITAVFVAVAFIVLLKVRNINVEGNNRYTTDEILSAITVSVGENMYNFDADNLADEVKTALPYISEVKIKRKLPSTLELSVEEKKASMYMSINDEIFILSSDLLVLELTNDESKTEGLTKLIPGNLKRCIVGEHIDFRDSSSFETLGSITAGIDSQFTNGEITEIDMSSRFDIWLKYTDRFTVFVGNSENCELKMKFLKKIIAQIELDKKGRIDISNVARGAFKEGELVKTT